MFAVMANYNETGTDFRCRICSKFFNDIYVLTPKEEENDKLKKLLGHESNWAVCDGCMEELEKRTGYKTEFTNAETVMEYEYEHYEKEDFNQIGKAVHDINKKSSLCPFCGEEMHVKLGQPKSTDPIHAAIYYNVEIKCNRCGFQYSDTRAYLVGGWIADHDDKTVTLEYSEEWILAPDGTMDEPNPESKRVTLQHDNLDKEGLKALCKMGEFLNFLIIDNRLIRILTGNED